MYNFSQIRSGLSNSAFAVLLIASAVVVIPAYGIGFSLPILMIVGLLGTLSASLLLFNRVQVVDLLMASLYGKLLLLFLAVLFLSVAWSIAPVMSLMGASVRHQGVLTHGAFLAVSIFTVTLARQSAGRETILRAMIISNLLVVLYGILEMVGLDPLGGYFLKEAFLGRVFSTLGHPNFLGTFIVLTVPFVCLHAYTRRGTNNHLTLILLLFNGVVFIGTGSRSALLGLLSMLLLALLLSRPSIKNAVRSCTVWQGLWCSFLLLVSLLLALLYGSRRFIPDSTIGDTVSARLFMWDAGLRMIIERPFGYGVDTLSLATPRFIGKDLYRYESLTTTVDRLHTLPLDTWMHFGPIGVLLLYTLSFALFRAALHYTGDRKPMVHACMYALCGCHISLLFGFFSLHTALFFWVIVGCLIGLLSGAPLKTFPRIYTSILTKTLLLVSITVVVVSWQWMSARSITSQAELAYAWGDSMDAVYLQQEAVRRFRFDRDQLVEAIEVHLRALEQMPDSDPLHADLSDATDVLLSYLETLTQGNDGMLWLLKAWFSAINGEHETSMLALKRAEPFYLHTITHHRFRAHIFSLLSDTAAVQRERDTLRSLLPEAVWVEGTATRRILRKQHPWLEDYIALPSDRSDSPPRREQ